ncbi:MAG: AgmX/PglI C-terminal domain-containing protein [Myxococcota bacterium]
MRRALLTWVWLVVGCVRAGPTALESVPPDAWQCVARGRELVYGVEVPRDEGRAVQLFERACELGSEQGCFLFGRMTEWGRGVPRDEDRARRLWEARCRAGSAQSCAEVQRLDALFELTLPGQEFGRATVGRVVQGHRDALQYCYEAVLKAEPNLAGRVEVSFVVSASGAVTLAELEEDSIRRPFMSQCILEQVRAWRFPTSSDGEERRVAYPFVFSAVP